ncbi:MAG: N-6 DNA methylase [Candidatus Latescibacteria bacterium]|nr:N-6 DNA methylase [Candidatus Latescibacterota bacterium]
MDKVLTRLGFAYLPNTRLPVGEREQEPDYILFADEATKNKVLAESKVAQYTAALSLLEAKKANHPLNAVSRRETPGRFPHQQVRDYLQAAADSSGKPFFNWAILTNGNRWRLYCRDAHPGSYFEFNFEDGIRSIKRFTVFAALFRPLAFTRDSEGQCPLDDLRAEALQYQTELEDDLRERVFKILVRLANGFYRRAENKISNNDLDKLYQNSLIFLYRLLFVLYAEGRGLLPVKSGPGANKNYRERYSLQRLLPRLRNSLYFSSDEFTELYEGLLSLFHLINGDQPSRNKACDVPRYNGGLFDSKEYKLLERWRIGERTVADVLCGLMFSPIPVGKGEQESFDFGETIDYADLEVRQLGSIYEGLLENHLELEGDHLVLRGDRAERKATGTYYTPDYIVQYIVRNTLKPLCDEINKSSEVQDAIKKELKDNSFAKAVLKLNILDPAMGSGHFLVRATEFLADEIIKHSTTEFQTESVSSPLSREEILSQGKMPVTRGLSHEEAEISYWRRRVVESCIYGVDLNPLAVELAKLSLWLTCIATDQPLSFLDHHLRPGNSLIGARLAELGAFPERKKTKQISLSFGPDLPKAVSQAIRALKEIEETETVDISTIEEKKSRWHKEVWSRLEPYRAVADLWTSTFFGTQINETAYQHLAKLLVLNPSPRTKEARELKKKMKPYLAFLEAAKNKEEFFHWELEFPEVFFNEAGTPKESPGFDAVIGNPPYGAGIENNEKGFINVRFNCKTHDSAAYFLEVSQNLSRKTCGMIVPKSIAFYSRWTSIRELILSQKFVSHLLDVGIAFKDVNYEQLILILSKGNGLNLTTVNQAIPLKRPKQKKQIIDDGTVNIGLMRIANVLIFRGVSDDEEQVIQKIKEISIPFKEIIRETYRGLYIPDSEKKQLSSGNCEFVNRVPDVQRYFIEKTWKIDISHRKEWMEKAEKILVPRLFFKVLRGNRLIAFYDKGKLLTTEKLVNVTLKAECNYRYGFILALINSPLISFYLQRILFSKTTETSRVMDEPYIGIGPIRHIAFVTPKEERQRLLEKLKTDVEVGRFEEVLAMLEECLPKDEKGNFITEREKSDVVHDLLAFLAERMIEMNKEKQELTKGFLTWLEREIAKGSIEGLKIKTKIKEFHGYDFDALIEVLRQNRLLPKLIAFGDQRQEALKKAYDATMSSLTPLKQKIAATDNLIDEVVYKLYGLTHEEIKIVERTDSKGAS